MHCPFCSAVETRVIDSRLTGEGGQVRRRRECIDCKNRFTTYETAEFSLPRVIKSDGSREPFREEKLRAGMLRALEKRPVASEKIEASVNQVKKELQSQGEREIPSREIGESLMRELQKLDHVAYVRFASVYRRFQDIDEFRQVVDSLEDQPDEPASTG
jgi:transcriptional repressor NrdR